MTQGFALVAFASPGEPAVGYAIVARKEDEHELIRVGVDPAFRREGVFGPLIVAFVQESRQRGALGAWLRLAAADAAAYEVCDRAGFRYVDRVPDYYGEGRDMIRLRLGSTGVFGTVELKEAFPNSIHIQDDVYEGALEDELEPLSEEVDESGSWWPPFVDYATRQERRLKKFFTAEQERDRGPGSAELLRILRRVVPLLTAWDYEVIEQGVELLASLGEPRLYDALLGEADWREGLRFFGPLCSVDRGFAWNRYAAIRLLHTAHPLSDKARALIESAPEELMLSGMEGVPPEDPDAVEYEELRGPINLQGVQVFSKTSSLELFCPEAIHNLSVVSQLPRLEQLHLYSVPTVDLAEIDCPTLLELKYKVFGHTSVALSGIERLPRLEVLSVLYESYTIGIFGPNRRWTHYYTINSSRWSGLRSTEPLRGCARLRSLTLQGNSSLSTEPLLHLRDLEILKLSHFATRDLSFLREMTRLRHLSIVGFEGLEDISVIAGLLDLEILELSYLDDVPDLSPLESLPALQRIYARGQVRIKEKLSPRLRELVHHHHS